MWLKLLIIPRLAPVAISFPFRKKPNVTWNSLTGVGGWERRKLPAGSTSARVGGPASGLNPPPSPGTVSPYPPVLEGPGARLLLPVISRSYGSPPPGDGVVPAKGETVVTGEEMAEHHGFMQFELRFIITASLVFRSHSPGSRG